MLTSLLNAPKVKGIALAVFIGVLFYGAALLGLSPLHARLVGVVAFLVTLWTNGALPLGVVSLLPVILFPALGIIDLKTVSPNYARPIIFLFLGGFMLAIAIAKTHLHTYLSRRLLRMFPPTPRGIIYALAVTSALLSAILSNTTITLMLMPIGLHLTDNPKLKVRFLLAIAYGASIGGIITPVGTPPNMFLLGFLESVNLPAPTFGEWVLKVAPVALLMLLTVPWMLSLVVKAEKIPPLDAERPLDPAQRRLLYILASLVFLLFINTPLKPYYPGLGLNEKLILLGYGLLMFVPRLGFLDWHDAREVPYEIVFLFGAGFTIAAAFEKTGLAAQIAHQLDFITHLPLIAMLFLIALFVSFSTEVMSNTALTSIALPVFYEFARGAGNNAMVVMMTAAIAASYAFMLPIATPPNAIVMSSRAVKVKEMARIGFWANMAGVIFLTLAAYLGWTR